MAREESWASRLAVLQAELRADVSSLSDLRAVSARAPVLERLLADLERHIRRSDRAAVIAIVGATGAGKSALLNALAGSPIAQEGVDRPTTRQPVIYAPDDVDVTELLAGLPGGASTVHPLLVRYDPTAGPWTAQVLIDTPDLNSVAEQHRAMVEALAERSDALVVVLHHQSVVEESPVSFLDHFARRRGLLFVLNRADELITHSRTALMRQIRDLAERRWGAGTAPVVCVSAKLAQLQPDPSWIELRQVLLQMVRESSLDGLRRHNVLGAAEEIAAIFESVRREIEDDLRSTCAEVSESAQRLTRRMTDEISTRMSLRQDELGRLFSLEAAARWDGPGGWALRAGGLAALGAGAGAMLWRRSPLVATGTAVGALAIDEVQRAFQKRRALAAEGLLPSREDFDAFYADAFSGLRVRVARLTGNAQALDLPGSERVFDLAAGALGRSWERLVDVDLPLAAERSALRWIRWLLDAPVYALAVWVTYLVAAGFVQGRYTGMDFLVNALLLVLAYLLLVRFAVRRALGWRARRLLRQATRAAIEVFRAELDGLRERVEQNARRHLRSVDRLCGLRDRWKERIGAA